MDEERKAGYEHRPDGNGKRQTAERGGKGENRAGGGEENTAGINFHYMNKEIEKAGEANKMGGGETKMKEKGSCPGGCSIDTKDQRRGTKAKK